MQKERAIEQEVMDLKKSEQELWSLGEDINDMNEFPGFSIDTIEDSDNEPNTISF